MRRASAVSFSLLFLAELTVGAESVHFSSRAELLVSKLGRSSKLSPRFLIIVRDLAHDRAGRD
jgi:hypothetical protein